MRTPSTFCSCSLRFGVSAFLRSGSAGAGLGIAGVMYVLSLIANITEKAEFLKYVTPFGFCGGADIVSDGHLDGILIAVGMGIGLLGILAAYLKYAGKDIH